MHNSSSNRDNSHLSPSSNDINSYLGKILTINHHQVLVESILGQGGFAFVFLVKGFNQQRYALKRMYVNNPRDLSVCQREIDLLKEFISHPNIVTYVDASIRRSSKPQLYIEQARNEDDDAIHEILLLTEYCSNGSLINRLNEQRSFSVRLNERDILKIFTDICRAVSACHHRRPQPILHRDIKLENIVIDVHQSYVLCDFGSAILLSPGTGAYSGDFQQYSPDQLTTNVIHRIEEDIQRYTTVSYRAPEMVDLYSRVPITLKADIWAMGCLLYKLMYNVMPFGDSILAIQNGTFVLPDDTANDYSRELNLLVRYMLEVDITKRPDIWQVSYVAFKLFGVECPIPNRCQSKLPDMKSIPKPLTDSESRNQRKIAIERSKSSSSNVLNENPTVGTTINPRERPRGIIPPSISLLDINPNTISRSTTSTNTLLMFDDNFGQVSSHTNSLTNISDPVASSAVSRTKAFPPGAFSQQQQQPMSHRRSASHSITSTSNPSSFINTSAESSGSNPTISSAGNRLPPTAPKSQSSDKKLSAPIQEQGAAMHYSSVNNQRSNQQTISQGKPTDEKERRKPPMVNTPSHYPQAIGSDSNRLPSTNYQSNIHTKQKSTQSHSAIDDFDPLIHDEERNRSTNDVNRPIHRKSPKTSEQHHQLQINRETTNHSHMGDSSRQKASQSDPFLLDFSDNPSGSYTNAFVSALYNNKASSIPINQGVNYPQNFAHNNIASTVNPYRVGPSNSTSSSFLMRPNEQNFNRVKTDHELKQRPPTSQRSKDTNLDTLL